MHGQVRGEGEQPPARLWLDDVVAEPDADEPRLAVQEPSPLVVKEPADSPWTGARLLFDACQFATENHNYDLTLKLAQLWELRGGEEESSLAFEALAELGLG